MIVLTITYKYNILDIIVMCVKYSVYDASEKCIQYVYPHDLVSTYH